MSYHTTQGEHGNSFETFWMHANDWPDVPSNAGYGLGSGWFWWFCEPGCPPEGDGEPNGPFDTEQAAIDDCNAYCNS